MPNIDFFLGILLNTKSRQASPPDLLRVACYDVEHLLGGPPTGDGLPAWSGSETRFTLFNSLDDEYAQRDTERIRTRDLGISSWTLPQLDCTCRLLPLCSCQPARKLCPPCKVSLLAEARSSSPKAIIEFREDQQNELVERSLIKTIPRESSGVLSREFFAKILRSSSRRGDGKLRNIIINLRLHFCWYKFHIFSKECRIFQERFNPDTILRKKSQVHWESWLWG